MKIILITLDPSVMTENVWTEHEQRITVFS